MPSKRTNDSVEQILQELSHQQARDGVRDSVNERKVDEILKSVGIDTDTPGSSHDILGPIGQEDLPQVEISGGVAEDRFSTTVLDDLLGDLPSVQRLKKKSSQSSRPKSATPTQSQPPRTAGRTPATQSGYTPARQPETAAPRQTAGRTPATQSGYTPARQPETAAPRQTAGRTPATQSGYTPARQPETATPRQTAGRTPATQSGYTPARQPETAAPRQTPERSGQADAGTAQPVGTTPATSPERDDASAAKTGKTTTFNDTTGTSVIKNFLLKMAPGADHASTHALNEGKEQFQQFFGKSAAVVPDAKGKLRDPAQHKRGLFGLGRAEDAGRFVPINIFLGGRREEAAPQPQPEPEEEYEEPQTQPEDGYREDADEFDDGEAAAPVTGQTHAEPRTRQEPEPTAEPRHDTGKKTVYHSQHSTGGSSAHHAGLGGNTVSVTFNGIKEVLRGGSSSGSTGTVYRKKRNTIEFTPGQKLARTPEPQPQEENIGEPVGEPVMTPTADVTSTSATAFNVSLNHGEEAEDTKDFLKDLEKASETAAKMAARAAKAAPRAQDVTRPAAPVDVPDQPARTQPVQSVEPQTAGQPEPQPVSQPSSASENTFEEISQAEAVSMTGEVRLSDIAAGRTEAAENTADFAADLAHAGTHEVSPDTADFMAQLDAQPRPRPDTGAFVKGIEQSINEEEDDAGVEDRFAQAAGVLTDTSELEEPTAHHTKAGIRLTGRAEDETPDGEKAEAPFEEENTAPSRRREYEHVEDAPAVRRDLNNQILLLTAAAIVSGAAALVMLYLGIAAGGGLPIPGSLNPQAGATPLLATMLVLLLFCCALNWHTMLDGLKGLVKGPTADTLPALAALGSVVQLLVFLIQPDWYNPDKLCLLAGPAALILCFNALGKRLDALTTRENFQLVSAKVDHAVAYRLKDTGILRAVTRGLDQPRPSVLVSRPTRLMKDFLASSGAHRTSDKNQQQLGRLVGGLAVVALLFTLLYRRDAGLAFTAMAGVLCLGAPLAGTLLSALPARLMQRSAAQVGAVIPGWRDIRQLGRINVIQVSTRDLFPRGCVKLCGIKPMNNETIDRAIIYAASMMAQGAPTLRDVFMGMIGDNRKLLDKVDDFETVYGMGYVGWVNGERVLAGNRHLMEKFDVAVPSLEYEKRHTVNQRRVIYLAVSGKLYSMFQVVYQAESDTAAVLDGLRRSGMSLIVDCDDFNCDEALLEAAYTLPTGTVRVLDAKARKALEPAIAWLPESEGNMLHLGSFVSYVGGLEAAAGAAEGERKAAMILSMSVLLSCVLAVIMVLAGGIAALPLPALVLYQAAWAVLALIFPLLQRY